MQKNDNDDYETPIEEWPGYLGHTWDQELFAGPELRELAQFDWDAYRELAPTDVREIALDLASGRKVIKFDVYSDIAELLDALPSIDVTHDSGPDDAGPASGSGYIFCLANGSGLKALGSDISALVAALKSDRDSFR